MKNASIWTSLNRESQFDEIVERSHERPQVIFKHSTRCGISRMAKGRIERGWDYDLDQVDLYYLDLLNYRSVSNMVAEKTGVQHESPQMMVMVNGEIVHDSSHGMVLPESVMPFVATAE